MGLGWGVGMHREKGRVEARGCSTLWSMGVMPVVTKTMSNDKPSSTWLSRCEVLCQGRQS